MLNEEGSTTCSRATTHAEATRARSAPGASRSCAATPAHYSAALTAVLMPEGHDADAFRKVVLERSTCRSAPASTSSPARCSASATSATSTTSPSGRPCGRGDGAVGGGHPAPEGRRRCGDGVFRRDRCSGQGQGGLIAALLTCNGRPPAGAAPISFLCAMVRASVLGIPARQFRICPTFILQGPREACPVQTATSSTPMARCSTCIRPPPSSQPRSARFCASVADLAHQAA